MSGRSVDVAPIVGAALAGMTNPANMTLGEGSHLANDLGANVSQSAIFPSSPPSEGSGEALQPQSGINFVLYNSSLDVVEGNTGYLPVDDRINAIQILATDQLVMKEAGFLEIFVNNDAQTPVYYDNMTVTRSGGSAMEVNAYYPYGMIIPNLSISAMPSDYNAYKYNSKEEQKELGLNWLSFDFRMYDPVIGRFMNVDPIAEKFYHVSPYNYAENNPVTGIDLWGLQYLNHNVARVIAQNGRLDYKLSNFHNVTANRIRGYSNNPANWKTGHIGVSQTVGQIRMSPATKSEVAGMDNSYTPHVNPASNPSNINTERGAKKDGTPDMRQKERTIAAGSAGSKTLSKGVLAVNAVNAGLELAGGLLVNHDKNLVNEHSQIATKAIDDVNTAISQGMIPNEFMNINSLSDIVNVVLQGESVTNSQAIMDIGKQILQDISNKLDEELLKKIK